MSEETKTNQSLADLLRVHIDSKIKSKYDYSTATSRKQDVLTFIEANKQKLPKDFTFKKVRDSHLPILKIQLDKAGVKPESLGISSKKKLKYNPTINSEITPDPQAGSNDTTPKNKPTQGQPVVEGQPIVAVPEVFDEAAVASVFSALFLTLRIAVPDMELLTPEEKESLGKIWKAAFNIYFSNDKWAVIGIPLMATLGIAMPKILEGRKKGKIRKSKEEGQEIQNEIDIKNENKDTERKKDIDFLIKQDNENKPQPAIENKNQPKIGEVSHKIIPNTENKSKDVLPKPEKTEKK